MPALAATWYNDWSFTIINKYVNGGDNGVYCKLNSGRFADDWLSRCRVKGCSLVQTA